MKTRISIFTISISLLLISVWMLTHPYAGIIRDARLYELQAMSHTYPDIFRNDIFLRFDSQENYSIFSRIHLLVINLTNFSIANILLFLFAQCLWFGAAFSLCGRFYKGNLRILSFAFIALMPAYYGSGHIFSFGESFLTPRLFAESFVLFSIYFALKDRIFLFASWLLAALIMHPIMAGTGAILFSVYFALKNKKTVFVSLAIGIVPLVLGALEIKPFVGIFKFIDNDWVGVIQQTTQFLFVTNWTTRDFLPFIASLISIAIYAYVARGKKQTLAISIAIASSVTLLSTIILGDILKNWFILQLQVWRIYWLLLFFGYLVFPSIYFKLKKTQFRTSLLVLCCVLWLSPPLNYLSSIYLIAGIIIFILVLCSLPKICYLPKIIIFLNNRLTKDLKKGLDTFFVFFCIFLFLLDFFLYLYALYDLQPIIPNLSIRPLFYSQYGLFVLSIVSAVFLYYQLRLKTFF